MENKNIYVYFDNNNEPILMGVLFSLYDNGKEIITFEYDENWLKTNMAMINFDPNLSFYSGRQYLPQSKQIFGMFSDCCPDRWGRKLIDRKEEMLARELNKKPKKMNETDYLLGVYDEGRMGALRFSLEKNGKFLENDKMLATPPMTSLRELEEAVRGLETEKSSNVSKWINQLIAPGTSLGGARPKASVQDLDGSLWIAKFPSKNDDVNIGAWEMVVHELAKLCGLNVPEAKIMNLSEYGSTYLSKRFDRQNDKRIHFASAMTLLDKNDGDRASYLDIAGIITSNSPTPKEDLFELWKRIVFSIAVSNTDDHLRNHGFLLQDNLWKLAPMYDVNPNVYGSNLSLNINTSESYLDFKTTISSAKYFGISEVKAKEEIKNIVEVVTKNWRSLAQKYSIHREEIERMSPAFEISKTYNSNHTPKD